MSEPSDGASNTLTRSLNVRTELSLGKAKAFQQFQSRQVQFSRKAHLYCVQSCCSPRAHWFQAETRCDLGDGGIPFEAAIDRSRARRIPACTASILSCGWIIREHQAIDDSLPGK